MGSIVYPAFLRPSLPSLSFSSFSLRQPEKAGVLFRTQYPSAPVYPGLKIKSN
ncbi:hypothetical protein HMPREF3293_01696 [Christensenella minuta]|uniref:Uncharacterized protein n=1 Tax=Christensenella minuta TaxID=626937 RepID=A0A136Q4A2_9FIRM|nr:hypothetical protein HMPREF3293_01696 [Christensenella minuta]